MVELTINYRITGVSPSTYTPYKYLRTTQSTGAWNGDVWFKFDMATSRNDRNNPDTWVTSGEIDFGDGTYGIRRTGNITGAANAQISTTLYAVTSETRRLVSYGGDIQLGSANRKQLGVTGTGLYAYIEFTQGVGFTLVSQTDVARSGTSNNAYSVWVRYTKA